MKWRKISLLTSAASCVLAVAMACPVHATTLVTDNTEINDVSLIENKGSYKVLNGDTSLGDIDVYVGDYGAFVSLDSLLSKLGYALYSDEENQRAQITFPDQSTLMLNWEHEDYMQGGQIHPLKNTDYIIVGPYIFLSTSFVNQTFPIGLSLDQAARRLRVENALILPNANTQKTSPALPINTPEIPTSALFNVIKPEEVDTDVIYALQTTEPNPPAPLNAAASGQAPLMTPMPSIDTSATQSSQPDDFPVPLAAPRLAVIVDDYLHRGNNAPAKTEISGQEDTHAETPDPARLPSTPIHVAAEVPGADALGMEQGEGGVPLPPGQPQLPLPAPVAVASEHEIINPDEENDLILQPKIKQLPPSDVFIEAFEKGGIVYLPFNDMMALMEILIKFDMATGIAEGSFGFPSRSFELNLAKNDVRVDDHSFPIENGDIIKRNKQFYVSAAALDKWLNIKAEFKRQSMLLKIDSPTVLPVEARLQRHAEWEKLLAANNANTMGEYEKIQNPYQLAAWPSLDVTLASNIGQTGGKQAANGNYSILSGGDLGYMTTNFLMTGTDQNSINNLRVTSGRKDPDADLLGGLHATNLSIGDIESPSVANVTSDPNGRGVLVTNRALNASSDFDVHTFVGNALPGWEVELYQNKTLLAFQTIGADGRYTFTNVPLLYGNNDFHIVLYGPQGQTEERIETLMVGDSMLKENKVEYTFSANQKDMGTLDALTSMPSVPAASMDLRAVSEMRYGVTKDVTAGVALVQTTEQDSMGANIQHRYASTTVDTNLGGAFVDLNAVRQLDGGWMAGVTGLTSIDDISLRMRHRQYRDFTSETENTQTGLHKMDSEIDATGQFYAPLIQDYNLGWKIERETFVSLPSKLTYSSTFSKSIMGVSMSNTLSYVKSNTSQTQGTTGLQTRFGNVLVRADAQYEEMPSIQFQDATLTTQYRLSEDLTAQTKIDKEVTTSRATTLVQSLIWSFDKYQLSLNGNFDSHNSYAVGLSLSFSLAHDPAHDEWKMQRQSAAESGSIATRIYQDDNFNGKHDEGEKTIADARPRINQLPLQDSLKDGSYISPVSPYEPINVGVDPASLKDPMLSPETKGFQVITRPGDTVLVDLPVISTSEVDGIVKIADDTDISAPLTDIVVELLDSEGKVVKRVISEADGYFIFDKVRPGNYTLSIPAEALAKYDAQLITTLSVNVAKASDFLTGNNLLLHTHALASENQDKAKHASEPESISH